MQQSPTRCCPWGSLTWNRCGSQGWDTTALAARAKPALEPQGDISVVLGVSRRSAASRETRETQGAGAGSTLLPAGWMDGMEAGSAHCCPRTHLSPSPHPPTMDEGEKKVPPLLSSGQMNRDFGPKSPGTPG